MRRNKKFSKLRLSRLSGVAYGTITAVERGQGDVKLYTLIKLSQALDTDVIQLLQIAQNAKLDFLLSHYRSIEIYNNLCYNIDI